MKIPRIYSNIGQFIQPNKVLALFGPRRVGKTTLLTDFLATCNEKYRLESGDDIHAREIFGSEDLALLKEYTRGYGLIIIDEAHVIDDVQIFESLRLLLNFQLPDRFLLTLILSGQPELRDKIERLKKQIK